MPQFTRVLQPPKEGEGTTGVTGSKLPPKACRWEHRLHSAGEAPNPSAFPITPPPFHLPPRLQPCREGHSAFPELQEKIRGANQKKNPTGHISSKGSSPLTSPEENFKARSGAAAAHPHHLRHRTARSAGGSQRPDVQPPLSGRSPQKTLRALAQRPPFHRLLLKRKQIKRRSPPRSPARCPRPCTHTGGDAKPARSRSKAARTAPRGRAPSSPRPEVRNPGAKPRSDPRCPHQPATPRGTTPGANPAACTRSPPRPAHLARSARGRRAHLLPKRPHTKS